MTETSMKDYAKQRAEAFIDFEKTTGKFKVQEYSKCAKVYE